MLRFGNDLDKLLSWLFVFIDDDLLFSRSFGRRFSWLACSRFAWLLSCLRCSSCLSCFLASFLFVFTLLHDLAVLGWANHSEGLHCVIPVLVRSTSLLDLSHLASQVDWVSGVILLCSATDHDLDALGSLGLQVTNCRVESELVLVGGVPAELHSRVAIVDDLEGGRLGLTDDAITDVKLVLKVIWQAFESDSLIETFTD